jgi:hypothetical protein
MDLGLLGVAFTIVVGVVLLAPMVLARRRAERERGLTPVFEAFCAGTFAWFGRTNIPMIRLSIYSDFLVVAVISPLVIPFAQLARAEVRSGVFGSRLLIRAPLPSGDRFRTSFPLMFVFLCVVSFALKRVLRRARHVGSSRLCG